jgi:hypothetical protein
MPLKLFAIYASRTWESCDSPQGPRKRRFTVGLAHARMFQLQDPGLPSTVAKTLDKENELQGFTEESIYEAWIDWMREQLSSLHNNPTSNPVYLRIETKAISCGWVYKAKKNEHRGICHFKILWWRKGIPRNQGRLTPISSSRWSPTLAHQDFCGWRRSISGEYTETVQGQ